MAKIIITLDVTDELDIKALNDPHEIAEDIVALYQEHACANPSQAFDVTFVSAEWAD